MDVKEPANKKFKKAIPQHDVFKTDQKKVVRNDLSYEEFVGTKTRYTKDSQPWHKNDIDFIRTFINKKMQRESTEEEMEQFLSTIKGQESKKAYRAWWQSTQHLVETESLLFLNSHPISLKFEPITNEEEEPHSAIERGNYYARIKLWDNTFFSCMVSPEWVEDWFEPNAIATV